MMSLIDCVKIQRIGEVKKNASYMQDTKHFN